MAKTTKSFISKGAFEQDALHLSRSERVASSELATLISRCLVRSGQPTAVPALHLYRSVTPLERVHTLYTPSLCFVAQGSKMTTLGGDVLRYDPEHFLLVSVSLPLTSQILEASPERPYLALHIDLEATLIAELSAELGARRRPRAGVCGRLSVGSLGPLLRDAVLRLVRLLETPDHIPVLAPLILRELCYLLLTGPEGHRLRDMALAGGQTQRVAYAIKRLLREYNRPLRVEALAQEVNMSVSAFYQHFKTVTAMSPLQYQKTVRLQEARRLLLGEMLDVADAGFRVGYESPSQFSREYRRLFGASPKQEVVRFRKSVQFN